MRMRNWLPAITVGLTLFAGTVAQAQEDAPRRGWLGITYVAPDDAPGTAVHVERVYPGSPAAEAGLRAGDEIVRWNGETDVHGALTSLRLHPGDTVRLRLRRDGSRDREVSVIAAERPRSMAVVVPRAAPEPPGLSPEQRARWRAEIAEAHEEMARALGDRARLADSLTIYWRDRLKFDSLAIHADSLHRGIELMLRDSLGPQLQALGEQVRVFAIPGPPSVVAFGTRGVAGAEFEEMNEGLSDYFGTDEGVLVLRVAPGTPAARARLEAGDVVVAADGEAVDSVDDLRRAVNRAQRSRDRTVELDVIRKGERRELDLKWE